MIRIHSVIAVLVACLACAGSSTASPVDVSTGHASSITDGACSIWVTPQGNQFVWTSVCGVAQDADGDGVIDTRHGSVGWDLCDGSDPNTGSFCYGGGTIGEADATADELSIDVGGGSAALHADLGGCRVDFGWTASSDAQTSNSNPNPRLYPILTPPAVGLYASDTTETWTTRDANAAGTICDGANVSGTPKYSGLLRWTETIDSADVWVRPTR